MRGKGTYAADQGNVVQSVAEDACRKASYGHPTLSPGTFTIYCQHGVCYGFQAMRSCESPRHPFDIFTYRFNSPLQIIVYDNACKLHIYWLNWEPAWYNTRLFVDRFHWRGHIGCSRGYCMDSYKTRMDTRSTNSQVNEQANSGLQQMKHYCANPWRSCLSTYIYCTAAINLQTTIWHCSSCILEQWKPWESSMLHCS